MEVRVPSPLKNALNKHNNCINKELKVLRNNTQVNGFDNMMKDPGMERYCKNCEQLSAIFTIEEYSN